MPDLARAFVHRALFPTFDAGAGGGAAAELAAVRERARREDLEAGRRQGCAEALATVTPRFEAACALLEKAAQALGERRETLAAELEAALPRIVVTLAERIVRRELSSEAPGAAVARALMARLVRGVPHASARVSPAVAEALEALLQAGGLGGVPLSIERDAALGDADWILDTGEGQLDGRLATQLDEAARLLDGGEA